MARRFLPHRSSTAVATAPAVPAGPPGVLPDEGGATLLLVLDALGRVTWANAAGRRTFTLPATPRVPPPLADLVHHEDRALLARLLTEARGSGKAEGVVQAGPGAAAAARHLSLLCTPAAPGSGADLLVQGWDVTGLVRRLRRLELHAERDPLTRLPDRNAFRRRLQQEVDRAAREGSRVAVLYADLDDFKQVNDRYGHEAGDAVLVATAQRFCTRLRPGDLLARVGGDEFAAVCPDADQDGLARFTDRLRSAAARPIAVRDAVLRVSVSLGVAFADGHDPALGTDVLLRRADEAMYACKRARRA